MTMTKKDYENVALVLCSEDMPSENRISLVKKFSEVFASENAHFKEDLFATASGVYRCKIKDCDFWTTDLAASKQHILSHIHNNV